jgi:hypothetical protein
MVLIWKLVVGIELLIYGGGSGFAGWGKMAG